MSDPKLLDARDLIKTILDDLDIAGHIVLHNAVGEFELLTEIFPSYSKLIGPIENLRLVSRIEDYAGDRQSQEADLSATASMCAGFAEILGSAADFFRGVSMVVDAVTGAEHTDLTKPDEAPNGTH